MASHKSYSLGELTALFGGTVLGDSKLLVSQIAPLSLAKAGELSFLTDPKRRGDLKTTQASAVILAPFFQGETLRPRIVTENPYAYYAKVATLLNPAVHGFSGVHATAVVESALPSSVQVGAKAVIGKEVNIGENVTVYPGCVIGDGVTIGEDTILYPNVVIYRDCILGARVIVQAGAVVGSDGFGFANEKGAWLKIPQIGRVVIGDEVEIGANTTIDRGALEDTVISKGVKLDNQIQIAHNIHIGEHTAIAGCVGIAGSTKIGAHCTIGGAAMIVGHLEISDRVNIAGGTVVSRSLKEPGLYAGVFPMEKHEAWAKTAVHVKRLEKLVTRVKELEKNLKN